MKIISLEEFIKSYKNELSHFYTAQSIVSINGICLIKSNVENEYGLYTSYNAYYSLKIKSETELNFDFIEYNNILYSLKIRSSILNEIFHSFTLEPI